MRKKLSKITIGLGIYIVVSAAFMLAVSNWLFKVLGGFLVVTCFKAFFILLAMLFIAYTFKIRLGLFKICATTSIFILGYFFALWQPYFLEKTHILTYGLLGYLAADDLIDTSKNSPFKYMIEAVIFVSLVSALDEIFQGLLPYRYAELKDFITNIISAILGIVLFHVQGRRKPCKT